jgi:hypothetical protein
LRVQELHEAMSHERGSDPAVVVEFWQQGAANKRWTASRNTPGVCTPTHGSGGLCGCVEVAHKSSECEKLQLELRTAIMQRTRWDWRQPSPALLLYP